MAQINILDANTINQIAAGEVVERPASVVKELVENAIDAKATAITIEIKDGGTSLIRITDNGTGIDKADIPVAFLRHSTSKIKSVEDLLIVSSLGFRGEALSSIASVSQIELITKTQDALMGVRYLIDGGKEKMSQDIGCPSGTTFIIRHLFYNTPARRKFLKSAMTEAGYINDLVQRLALSHPEISFKFISNNQTKLHTMGNMHLKDIIYTVFGRDIAANLLSVQEKTDKVSVSGFIGKPIISRGNRAYENYFINGRYIKSGVITKAIEEAYKTFIMVHKFPMTALHFEIDHSLIDVNVHPTKMEIRFNNNEEMYHIVYHAVRDALEGKSLIPEVDFSSEREERQMRKEKELEEKQQAKTQPAPPEPFEVQRRLKEQQAYQAKQQRSHTVQSFQITQSGSATNTDTLNVSEKHERAVDYEGAGAQKKAYVQKNTYIQESTPVYKTAVKQDSLSEKQVSDKNVGKQAMEQQSSDMNVVNQTVTKEPKGEQLKSEKSKPEQMVLFNDELLSKSARIRHKLVGQVFETYWVVEYDNKLFIIDQHAAHEKVLYEKLVKAYREKQNSAQYLNPPLILSLSLREEQILKTYKEEFLKMGFEVEPFGGNEYALRSVPMDLYGFGEKELLMTMIDCLSADSNTDKEEIIIDKMATAACKAAVKGNQILSFKEADALIDQLLEAQNPYTCPHGRPTIISMTQYDLEKKFKRIQS